MPTSDRQHTRQNPPQGLGEWIVYLAAYGSSMPKGKRRKIYVLTVLGTLCFLWAPVLLFLLLSPVTYTSKWDLIMPVTGAGQTVNLESIGQATVSNTSPFSQASVDPKVNYKAIATSKPVLKAAAEKLDMDEGEFGKPKIKLVDLTALIKFESVGRTAEEAQKKSFALYEALQDRLNQLRQDEFERREFYTSESLRAYNEKLMEAQEKIVKFQLSAKIISLEQFKDITLGIEKNRRDAAAMEARLSGLRARLAAQRRALGVSDRQTHGLLALQQDANFQELLRKRAEAAGLVGEYEAVLGDRHPRLLDARELLAGYTNKLRDRARVLGIKSNKEIDLIEALARTQANGGTVEALSNLIAEVSGMEVEVARLWEQIRQDEQRLEDGIKDATTLEDLERKQQVALAVFTSALAKIDLGRADNFASYPMLQMLTPPTLPYKADSLGKMLAIAGGMVGSIFCLLGFAVLWVRKPLLQKLLKSE